MAKCAFKRCSKPIKMTVPWKKYCDKVCKQADWALKRYEENKAAALKEANKAIK